MDNLVCRPRKSADVINLDEDDTALSIYFVNPPDHRPQSPPASLGKRSRTTSEHDDDSLVGRTHCELQVILGDHWELNLVASQSKVRRVAHATSSPAHATSSPAPACGQNVFNRLVKPEVHLIKTTALVHLDADALRVQFLQNLRTLLGPPVTLFNDIDNTSPPSHFTFISKNVLSRGVEPAPAECMAGCDCRKDNGRHIGCEHLSCGCVQLSEPNAKGRRYFPYSAAKSDYGCLRSVYIKMRNHIYECNDRCNCDIDCKNRRVQHGREIPLEIFKTKNRGWG